MNHDSKHNDFEYEKETFPKTPEHFKQLVVNQVAQEQQKNNISSKIDISALKCSIYKLTCFWSLTFLSINCMMLAIIL